MLKRLKSFFKTEPAPQPVSSFAFVSPEDYAIHITTPIGEMYQAAAKDLRETIENGKDPNPQTETGLANIYRAARQLAPEDWELVCTKEEAKGRLGRRAEVFQILRLWWTERQHREFENQPMYIHLTKDPGWED